MGLQISDDPVEAGQAIVLGRRPIGRTVEGSLAFGLERQAGCRLAFGLERQAGCRLAFGFDFQLAFRPGRRDVEALRPARDRRPGHGRPVASRPCGRMAWALPFTDPSTMPTSPSPNTQ